MHFTYTATQYPHFFPLRYHFEPQSQPQELLQRSKTTMNASTIQKRPLALTMSSLQKYPTKQSLIVATLPFKLEDTYPAHFTAIAKYVSSCFLILRIGILWAGMAQPISGWGDRELTWNLPGASLEKEPSRLSHLVPSHDIEWPQYRRTCLPRKERACMRYDPRQAPSGHSLRDKKTNLCDTLGVPK